MHFTANGEPVIPYSREINLRSQIEQEVIPQIPSDQWLDCDEHLPLAHSTRVGSIVQALLPHTTGSRKTDAVYVLECRNNSNQLSDSIRYLGRSTSYWKPDKVKSSRRLIYVGVAQNPLKRLNQHLNDPGNEGANFTGIFPPMRVLNVSWYGSYRTAERAEILTAELIQEEFPEDYVVQL